LTCTYPSLVRVIASMGFPLQKTGDTCVGNIENEDGTVCGVEQKLVHPRGRVVSTTNLIRHVTEMAQK
jgi:hypothetical protein